MTLALLGLLKKLWERSVDSFQANGKQLFQVYKR